MSDGDRKIHSKKEQVDLYDKDQEIHNKLTQQRISCFEKINMHLVVTNLKLHWFRSNITI